MDLFTLLIGPLIGPFDDRKHPENLTIANNSIKKARFAIAHKLAKVEAGGIEPARENDVSDCVKVTCEFCEQRRAARALHSGVSDSQHMASLDADLQIVTSNWYRLPQAVRNAILGLAQL